MIDKLTATIPSISSIQPSNEGETPFLTHRGFVQRGDQLTVGLNYGTKIDNHAAYAMS